MKKNKTFDCLEFKDKAQEEIYENIRNLSAIEEIEYFKSKVEHSSFKDFVNNLSLSLKVA